jgi:hypothetical protein
MGVFTKKINKWCKRYLFPELVAIPTAVASGVIVEHFSGDKVLTAYASTIGENVGYYGFIFFRDVKTDILKSQIVNKRYGIVNFFTNITGLIVEFGPAEVFDTLFVRPSLIFLFQEMISGLPLAIIFGKFSADIIFMIVVVVSYEARIKYHIGVNK